jgi:hypothetical protein
MRRISRSGVSSLAVAMFVFTLIRTDSCGDAI